MKNFCTLENSQKWGLPGRDLLPFYLPMHSSSNTDVSIIKKEKEKKKGYIFNKKGYILKKEKGVYF